MCRFNQHSYMVLKACQNVPVENGDGENGHDEPTKVPVIQPVDEVLNRKVSVTLCEQKMLFK
jgi:hypothetical protein